MRVCNRLTQAAIEKRTFRFRPECDGLGAVLQGRCLSAMGGSERLVAAVHSLCRFSEVSLLFRSQLLHRPTRSEEHTSELQSLMRTSYAVFCSKKQKIKRQP